MEDKKDIYFYGTVVIPAQLEHTDRDIVSLDALSFSKPRWVPDDDAAVCYQCAGRFNAVRRKHHCRQCGRVFCAQCCRQKMPLAHLLYLTEQRVCSLCQTFVALLDKAQSSDMEDKKEAARGLSEMCQEARLIISFVEMGGVIALVFLARERDQNITSLIVKSLVDLAAYTVLHSYMASIGVIKVLGRLLLDGEGNETSSLVIDVVNLLCVLCSTDQIKLLAVEDGVLDALFTLCHTRMSDIVCLNALRCVAVVAESDQVCDAIADQSRRTTLTKLLTLSSSLDTRVQEVAVRILWQISSTSDNNRRRIVEEDVYNGSSLADIFRNYLSTNHRVLTFAAGLLANLAVDESSQGALTRHLVAVCDLLHTSHCEVELLRHVARAFTGFSRHKSNIDMLMKNFESVCSKLLTSGDEQTRDFACQVTLALLSCRTETTIDTLLTVGASELLRCVGSSAELVNAMQRVIGARHQNIVSPPLLH